MITGGVFRVGANAGYCVSTQARWAWMSELP
ncbi:MAG: RNA polymerase subunit sigma-70, partial [Xanthomonas perforans]|nr:RNA polymerase subunit sigma-70 [Xanthomonas perforans]